MRWWWSYAPLDTAPARADARAGHDRRAHGPHLRRPGAGARGGALGCACGLGDHRRRRAGVRLGADLPKQFLEIGGRIAARTQPSSASPPISRSQRSSSRCRRRSWRRGRAMIELGPVPRPLCRGRRAPAGLGGQRVGARAADAERHRHPRRGAAVRDRGPHRARDRRRAARMARRSPRCPCATRSSRRGGRGRRLAPDRGDASRARRSSWRRRRRPSAATCSLQRARAARRARRRRDRRGDARRAAGLAGATSSTATPAT